MENAIHNGYWSGSEIPPRTCTVKMNSEEYFVVRAAEVHRPLAGCVPPALDALQNLPTRDPPVGTRCLSVCMRNLWLSSWNVAHLPRITEGNHFMALSWETANFWYLLLTSRAGMCYQIHSKHFQLTSSMLYVHHQELYIYSHYMIILITVKDISKYLHLLLRIHR